MRTRVGIVVVCWEDSERTVRCLESLLALRRQEGELEIETRIVVCDNGSSAPVAQRLENWIKARSHPDLSLLRLRHNRGYAAGLNAGFDRVVDAASPQFLWLLNNDVRAEGDALLALVKAAVAAPDVLMWGSTLVRGAEEPPGSESLLECAGGYRYSPATTRVRPCYGGMRLEEVGAAEAPDPDYISGAAMFCRAALLDRYGRFCEDYFLYYEELDLMRRLPQPPAIAWCPASVVYHEGGASTGDATGDRTRLRQYYENLNALRYTARFHKPLFPLVFLSRLFLKPVLFVWRREWHLFGPLFSAYGDFFLGRRRPEHAALETRPL